MVVLVVWSRVGILGSNSDLDHGGILRKPVLICESAGGLSLSSVSVSACCCWGVVPCLLDKKSPLLCAPGAESKPQTSDLGPPLCSHSTNFL